MLSSRNILRTCLLESTFTLKGQRNEQQISEQAPNTSNDSQMEVVRERLSSEGLLDRGINSVELSTKLKNEVLKKESALRSLHMASSKDDIDSACSLLESRSD